MYTRFFGLRTNPFGMTPDPAFLFVSEQHAEAFAGLTYAILNRRGFGVLTGDAGTGKTTLVHKVLASLSASRVRSSIIFHPTVTTDEFLEMIMLDFGLPEVPASKAQRLAKLQAFLLQNHQQGKISTLIIDEAHKLSPTLLEEIRLLGNFDSASDKLLQIMLVGQTELDEVLNRHDLRQLKQRIAVRMSIQALGSGKVEAYILCRWKKAGGQALPFTPAAIAEVAQLSKGLPRIINALCDNALLLAFAEGSHTVDLVHVQESASDLQMSAPESVYQTAAAPAAMAPAAAPAAKGYPTLAAPSEAPAPLRVPEFASGGKPSLLSRWAGKLRLGIS